MSLEARSKRVIIYTRIVTVGQDAFLITADRGIRFDSANACTSAILT